MSHRDDCPSRYEAERRGERDYERNGYRSYSTPYDSRFDDEGCPEAQRAYLDGQRHAEYRAEEEAAEQHAAERRRQQAEYERQQYQEYEQQLQWAEHEQWANEQLEQADVACPDCGESRRCRCAGGE